MPRFDPQHLAHWTGGRWTREPGKTLVGFGIDTRRLEAGQVFVALRTESRDGHDFLDDAAAGGAGAALVAVARPEVDLPQLVVADPLAAFQTIAREHRRAFPGRVFGITGSAGKTSTKNLLAGMLGPRTLATTANLNNHLGVPLTLTQLDAATHDFAVIEAGISGPGEMAPLAAMIEPDAAIVTLVDHAHTAGLGDLAGVAREKALLPAKVKGAGDRIFPAEVAALAPFQNLPATRVSVRRVDVMTGPVPEHSAHFMVMSRAAETVLSIAIGPGTPEIYTLRRTTAGMAQNTALAITLARRQGINGDHIQAGLAAWAPAALRGEVRERHGSPVYVDCYNANPAAMADALAAFDALAPAGSARLLVLGGMEELGDASDALHEELGRTLPLRSADRVMMIGTGAAAVRRGAIAAGARPEQLVVAAATTEIRSRVAAWEGPVFIKGSRKYRLETVLAEEVAVES